MMRLKLPELNHANWWPVEGIATFIDKTSERPLHISNYDTQTQSDGPKVIFSRAAVENALPTLLGMGFCPQQAVPEHHIPRSNCGIITEAWIDGDKLMVRGGVYGINFPEVVVALEKGGIGLCPAFHDTLFDHKNLPESITVLHTTFTAVNIVHSWAASFDNTKIWLTKRSYVAMTATEDLENQRKQRAGLIEAA
jgi:hypothetical protein